MMKKRLFQPAQSMAILLFTGLLPLSFTFSANGVTLLTDTAFRYIIWGGQAIVLISLLLSVFTLSKKQMSALTILYALVTVTFVFNEKGMYFPLTNNLMGSVLSCSIASVLITKLILEQN